MAGDADAMARARAHLPRRVAVVTNVMPSWDWRGNMGFQAVVAGSYQVNLAATNIVLGLLLKVTLGSLKLELFAVT